MIDLEKTFSSENSKEFKISLGDKILFLKNDNIISKEEESVYIYNIDTFQLITKISFPEEIIDLIQLKSEEILILLPYKVLMLHGKSYKLLSTTEVKGKDYDFHYGRECESGAERMFQLSDSTIAFVFNAAYDIDIYKKSEKNSLNFVKKIKTKDSCYSACEINDNNIAYNSTEDYRFGDYKICFSHNDKVIQDLELSTQRDTMFYYKEKNYLIAVGIYLYIIDLNKFFVIKKFPIKVNMGIGANFIDFKSFKNYFFLSVFKVFIFNIDDLELTKIIDFNQNDEDYFTPPALKLLFLKNKVYFYCNGRKEGYYFVDFKSDKKEFREGSRFIRIYNIINK
jgi:histidinol phosphatase-like enzyme